MSVGGAWSLPTLYHTEAGSPPPVFILTSDRETRLRQPRLHTPPWQRNSVAAKLILAAGCYNASTSTGNHVEKTALLMRQSVLSYKLFLSRCLSPKPKIRGSQEAANNLKLFDTKYLEFYKLHRN